MSDINLQSGESIIGEFNCTCSGPTIPGTRSGKLLLTNINLIFSYSVPKLLRTEKRSATYPLRNIRIVRGKPQIKIDKGDAHSCEIQLKLGKVSFHMGNHEDLSELVNDISFEITGENEDIVGAPKTFISDIANTLGSATKEFTKALGVTPPKQTPAVAAKLVTATCDGCGAPLSGKSGALVVCEYCCAKRQL